MDTTKIKAIIFDADDTLWRNEILFRTAEHTSSAILAAYGSQEYIEGELLKTELANMPELGFGAKAFTISMVETAIKVSGGAVTALEIEKIVAAGRTLLRNPATPYPGVVETLSALKASGKYRLAVLTKGELNDQNNKLDRSGLRKYFERVDVVADKTPAAYSALLKDMGLAPDEALMVGNSFKSDIDPMLRIGGNAVYIPAEDTWQYEKTEEYDHASLHCAHAITELIGLLGLDGFEI